MILTISLITSLILIICIAIKQCFYIRKLQEEIFSKNFHNNLLQSTLTVKTNIITWLRLRLDKETKLKKSLLQRLTEKDRVIVNLQNQNTHYLGEIHRLEDVCILKTIQNSKKR